MRNQNVPVPAGYVVFINKARVKPRPCSGNYLSCFLFSDLQSHCHTKSISPVEETRDATVHELGAIRYNPDGSMEYKLQHRLPWSSLHYCGVRLTTCNAIVAPLCMFDKMTCTTLKTPAKQLALRSIMQLKNLDVFSCIMEMFFLNVFFLQEFFNL